MQIVIPALPLPVTIPGGVFVTRASVTQAAPGAGNFARVAVSITPITIAPPRLAALEIIGFRAVSNQEISYVSLRADGALGASGPTPSTTIKRLHTILSSGTLPVTTELQRFTAGGFGATDESDGAAAANQVQHFLELRQPSGFGANISWPEGGGAGNGSGAPGIPLTFRREVTIVQPHLCGFILAAVAQLVNSALTADFLIFIREHYR